MKEFDYENLLMQIEKFYADRELPKERIDLSASIAINDCNKFVTNHLEISRSNRNRAGLPYLLRLNTLKEYLEKE